MEAKSGWLEKRGDDLLKGWRKRWCKLEGASLKYYASPDDSVPKGEIPLRGCSAEMVEASKYKRKFAFELRPVVTTRVYVLQAPSAEDRQDWLSEIKQAMLRIRREVSQEVDARKMELLLQQQEQAAVRRLTDSSDASSIRPVATLSSNAGYIPPAVVGADRSSHSHDQGPEPVAMGSSNSDKNKYEKYMSWLEETKDHSRRGTAASREESGVQRSLLSNSYEHTDTPYASMDDEESSSSCCRGMSDRCHIQ